MRLAVVEHEGSDVPVLRRQGGPTVALRGLAPGAPATPEEVLAAFGDPARRRALDAAVDAADDRVDLAGATRSRRPFVPRSVIGIGLNYRPHAEDLGAPMPQEPAYFTKDPRTCVSTDEVIFLPPESRKVTAEAELALVIGRRCWRVPDEQALTHVAGASVILDQCAEDILHRNTRFLTRSKNFPSFLVFGADVVTMDELTAERPLAELVVGTAVNGDVHSEAPVSEMLFEPARLVSFLSHVLPLEPGDMITTGTPGAATLRDGDRVTGHVTGIGSVQAAVQRPDPVTYAEAVIAQMEREQLRPPTV